MNAVTSRPFAACLLFLLSSTVPALAQEADADVQDDTLQEEARNLFEAGRTAFDAGRYEAALRYFGDAHELSDRPALLYNMGAAYERLQRNEEARDHYQRYLREVPDAPNRASCERRIALLEEIMQRGDAPHGADEEEPRSSNAEPSVSNSGSGGGDPIPWILAGVAGAVVVGGVVLLALSRVEADAVEGSEPGSSWADVEGAATNADAFGIAGWIAVGVGVAGVAGAIAWGVSAGGDEAVEVSVLPGGVQLRGRF